MYAVLMILLLAAMIYVYVKRSTAPDVMTPLLYGLVAVTILLSIGRLFRARPAARVQTAIAIQESFEEASAYMLGRTVAEDVPSGSTVLLIHAPMNQPALRERTEGMVGAFREGIGRTEMTLRLDAPVFDLGDEEELMLMEEIALSGAELQRMLQEAGDVEAVVSLIGTPFFRRPPPAGSVPPIYVMGGGDDPEGDIEIALERGLIRAAVSSRQDPDVDWEAMPRRGMSREDVFNLRFRIRRADR